MTELILAWTTVADKTSAEDLAKMAVQKQLAACVQVDGPVRSFYSWDGTVQDDQEWRLFFKTTSEKVAGLKTWMNEAHPYDNPEWISVAAGDVSTSYLGWARDVLN